MTISHARNDANRDANAVADCPDVAAVCDLSLTELHSGRCHRPVRSIWLRTSVKSSHHSPLVEDCSTDGPWVFAFSLVLTSSANERRNSTRSSSHQKTLASSFRRIGRTIPLCINATLECFSCPEHLIRGIPSGSRAWK